MNKRANIGMVIAVIVLLFLGSYLGLRSRVHSQVGDLQVSGLQESTNSLLDESTLIGKVKNNTNWVFKYLELDFRAFNKNEELVGNTKASIKDLDPGEKWKFTTGKIPHANVYKIILTKITASTSFGTVSVVKSDEYTFDDDSGQNPSGSFGAAEAYEAVAAEDDMKNIATSLEMYSTDYDGNYPDTLSQLVPKYISDLPHDPATGLPFQYKNRSFNYTISVPDPSTYGYAKLYYSSESGLVAK